MYEFNYHQPTSLEDVARLLGADEEAKIVAGGMTLVPTLKFRLAKPSDLVDLAAIPSLRGITDAGDALVIGAMTRHAEVERSPLVKQAIPALAALAHMIGDPAVRNRGTIGGSISNNDPAADYPAAVVGLGGTVQTTKRQIAADNFFTGMFETALDRTEIVTAVRLPKPLAACYMKFKNPASRYAIVGVFVARTGGRRAGRGDRRRTLRLPRPRDGGRAGALLHPGRDQGHHDPAGRAQLRHPRQRRIPRSSCRRDGPPRRRRLRISAFLPLRPSTALLNDGHDTARPRKHGPRFPSGSVQSLS